MAEYEWLPGRKPGGDAQAVGEELERLRARGGEALTTAAVVEAARNPASPLHACFEWDDAKAAGKHRLHQARVLMASIRVVTVSAGGPRRYEISNVSVRTDSGVRAYVPASSAARNPSYREQILERAARDFSAWRGRFVMIAGALGEAERLEAALAEELERERSVGV